jgi:hypothetical protein
MFNPQTAKGQVIGIICSSVAGRWVCFESMWQPW